MIDQDTVRWTDGTQSVYNNIGVNQEIVFGQASPDLDLDGIEDGNDWAASERA